MNMHGRYILDADNATSFTNLRTFLLYSHDQNVTQSLTSVPTASSLNNNIHYPPHHYYHDHHR